MNRLVSLHADVPEELLQSFLQAIRDWERQHPHVQIGIVVDAPTMSVASAEALLDQVDPPLPFRRIVKTT